MDNLQKCDCGKTAVYTYMPASDSSENPYYCDDCISDENNDGCSCNWHWIGTNASVEDAWEIELPEGVEGKDWRWVNDKKEYWISLDDRGRPYPCCEFDYDENGYEKRRSLELTKSQLSELAKLPNPEKWFITVNIHLKDGRILEEYYDEGKTYIRVNENDPITVKDIVKFTSKL